MRRSREHVKQCEPVQAKSPFQELLEIASQRRGGARDVNDLLRPELDEVAQHLIGSASGWVQEDLVVASRADMLVGEPAVEVSELQLDVPGYTARKSFDVALAHLDRER